MQILLANPRGFCAGVHRAISIVEHALKIYGSCIYVRHELVHNRYVVNKLRKQGVIFIENIDEVPDKAILIFSAHGVSQVVRSEAYARDFTILLDATCPLVTKVHMEVMRASKNNMEVILIGHANHPEIDGTVGQYNNTNHGLYLVESIDDIFKLKVKNENNLCFMTQTTLSFNKTTSIINALRNRFPKIIAPHKTDICYATTNRQNSVAILASKTEIVLVVGSKNSSNSNSLVELVKNTGKPAKLIDSADDIEDKWLHNINCVGITAGASAPDILVQGVVDRLRTMGGNNPIELIGNEEKIIFNIPKGLGIKLFNV